MAEERECLWAVLAGRETGVPKGCLHRRHIAWGMGTGFRLVQQGKGSAKVQAVAQPYPITPCQGHLEEKYVQVAEAAPVVSS